MRVFSLYILALLFAAGNLTGAEIDIVTDDPHIKSHIERRLKIVPQAYRQDSLTGIMLDLGYLDYRLDVNADNNITVYTGSRYNIGQIIIEGDINDTISVDAAFNRERTDRILDSTVGNYGALGYYYAAVTPRGFYKNDRSINLIYHLARGPITITGDIRLNGLRRTNPDYIKQLLPLTSGDTLTGDKLNQVAKSVDRLGFLSLADQPRVIPRAGYNTVDVEIDFIERKQFEFEGMGGYLPGEEEEFIYFLNLKGQNLFGRGQKAELLADHSAKDRTRFLVGYGQPLLATGFDFAYLQIGVRDYREQFYEFGAGLEYEFPVSEWFGLKGKLGWKNVEPAAEGARSFSVVTAGVGVDFGRIRHLRTEQAFHSQWLFNYAGRRYRPADTGNVLEKAVFNDTRNEIIIESQIPLGKLPAVYGRLLLQNVQTSERPLPVSELFYFGGPGSLRGYRNEQFDAQRLALGNLEFRLFLSRADHLYPFIDGAYFEDYIREPDNTTTKVEETRVGYGFGVVLASGQRKLRMELAWGEGIAFDQPRVAVSLISGF